MAAREPSAAVLAARARRGAAAGKRQARIEWYMDEVVDKVKMTMKQRVTLATAMLKDKVVRNISRPVTKHSTGRVTDRSKPGEFPKADTTQLMKTIFDEVRDESTGPAGYVGTPLDYGLILEVSQRLDRSFLVRTLNEEAATIKRILSGPLK